MARARFRRGCVGAVWGGAARPHEPHERVLQLLATKDEALRRAAAHVDETLRQKDATFATLQQMVQAKDELHLQALTLKEETLWQKDEVAHQLALRMLAMNHQLDDARRELERLRGH